LENKEIKICCSCDAGCIMEKYLDGPSQLRLPRFCNFSTPVRGKKKLECEWKEAEE